MTRTKIGTEDAQANGTVIHSRNRNDGISPDIERSVRSPGEPRPEIGTWMSDRTIYAGISPDTGRPLYVFPVDVPLTLNWSEAVAYAGGFQWMGHPRGAFRLPTRGELAAIFENSTKIGGFSADRSIAARFYWSSTEYQRQFVESPEAAWVQGEGYDETHWREKAKAASVRLVRS